VIKEIRLKWEKKFSVAKWKKPFFSVLEAPSIPV